MAAFVPTLTPFDPGVKVQSRSSHAGAKFRGPSGVVSVRADGMGAIRLKIERCDRPLERWASDFLRLN